MNVLYSVTTGYIVVNDSSAAGGGHCQRIAAAAMFVSCVFFTGVIGW